MVVPFLTFYLVSERRLTVVAAGEVVAGFGAGALIAPLVAGTLADRLGRRPTLLGSTLTSSASMVALAYARPTALVGVLVVALGTTLEAPRPIVQALVADLVAEPDRARAYAALFWVGNLGFAVAMVSAGFLAQTWFAGLFWIDAVTGAVFGLTVYRFVPEGPGRRTAAAAGRSPSHSPTYRQVLRNRVMVSFTLAVMTYYFVYLQADSTLPIAVHMSGLPPRVYGLCMALNGVLIAVAQPVVAPRLDRFEPARVWALGVACVGLGFALTAAASTTAGYLLSVVVWTAGEILPATGHSRRRDRDAAGAPGASR